MFTQMGTSGNLPFISFFTFFERYLCVFSQFSWLRERPRESDWERDLERERPRESAYVHVCACVRACIRAYIHTCMHAYIRAYPHPCLSLFLLLSYYTPMSSETLFVLCVNLLITSVLCCLTVTTRCLHSIPSLYAFFYYVHTAREDERETWRELLSRHWPWPLMFYSPISLPPLFYLHMSSTYSSPFILYLW